MGARKPLKRSGLVAGRITISCSCCFAFCSLEGTTGSVKNESMKMKKKKGTYPAISFQETPGDESNISFSIMAFRLSFCLAAFPFDVVAAPPAARAGLQSI